MVKHCAVCKQSYDDHLPACPHCGAANVKPRPADEEHVDLASLPPAQGSDSATSAQALEALLADSSSDNVVEVLPEPDTGAREHPPTGVHHLEKSADENVDMHDVVEDIRTKGSGVRERPPTGIDIIGMVEGPLDILEEPSQIRKPAPPSAAETQHLVDIYPEPKPAPVPQQPQFPPMALPVPRQPETVTPPPVPPQLAAEVAPASAEESVFEAEPIVVGDASSQSGVIVDVAAPASSSGIDIEALEVTEPISGISSKDVSSAEPVDEAEVLSTLMGPDEAAPAATDDDAAAVLGEDSAIMAEPISDVSGQIYVAPDAAESPSGSITVAEVEPDEEAPPASGIVVAGREPVADLGGEEMPSGIVVADVPNLELDSGTSHKEQILDAVEVAETASGSMHPADVVEVAETPSGSMAAPPASGVKPTEEKAGVFDDGEEVLDVTEEASSAALGSPPPIQPFASAPPASGVSSGRYEEEILDAEEVAEGGPASGEVPSDIINEALLESGVNLGGSGRTEAPSSALNLGGPPSGSSRKKPGSGPVLDDKGIEDLLMGPEEGVPPSGRMPASGVIAEEPVEEAPAAEEEEAAAPKAKKKGFQLSPMQSLAAGVGVGILILAGLAAGAWMVSRDTVMGMLGVQIKQPPPQPTPLEQAHGLMDRGQYGEALKKLEGADRGLAVSARAQARWLKYLNDHKNKAIDPKSKEVTQALNDARAANNDALQKDIATVLAAQKDRARADASEKNFAAAKQAKEKAEKELVKAQATGQQALGALATQLKVKAEEVPQAVSALASARTELDTKLKDIDTKLKAAKVEGEGAAGVAKLAEEKDKLERERGELASTIKGAFDVLKSEGLAPPDVDARKALVEATKMAVDKAKKPMVVSQNPEQKLDTWIALLQDRSHNDPDYVRIARNDGERVLAEAGASQAAKAKAQYVIALADRNSGQYGQAKQAFDKAIKAAAAAKAGVLAKVAGQTLKELTDAGAYYLPRAERMQAAGDFKGALEELDAAVKQNPSDGRLRARRALMRLESQPSGKVDPAAQNLIQQDAEAARQDPRTAAEGTYVLGRLDEEQGNFDGAEKQYRAALEAHKGNPDEATKYIIALARVLQRERGAPPDGQLPPPAPAPKEAKDSNVSQETSGAMPTQGRGHGTLDARLLTALLVGVQPPPDEAIDPATVARLKESIDLAKQLIKSADPKVKGQGYILMGQALSRQGKRGEGLQLYVKGMQLAYPGEATRELTKMIDVGPAAIPEPERVAPMETFVAERHYGKGLHEYWQGQYAAAEDDFAKAVAAFDQDARYHYYLGLSRLQQGNEGAALRDFQKGARLERENRPGPRLVNASLERLQGQLRFQLDEYRQKQP
jgi:hypothetical protein